MSAHYNRSLSIIHDGLDSIKTGLETMETYIQSALYLYHDKKDYLQGKERLSKGFRKTKASLLQGCCKVKQAVDTISKANLTFEMQPRQSLRSTFLSNSNSIQHSHMNHAVPPKSPAPTDDELMMDEPDNESYESMLLEASINSEQADSLAKDVTQSANVTPHEQLLPKSNVHEKHAILQSSIHAERAKTQLCENKQHNSGKCNVKQNTHLSPQSPTDIKKKTRILPQWCYSTPIKTPSKKALPKRANNKAPKGVQRKTTTDAGRSTRPKPSAHHKTTRTEPQPLFVSPQREKVERTE